MWVLRAPGVKQVLQASTAPSLDLNFINGSAFDARISFSRASSATYFDNTGMMQVATVNIPRTDYDPITHAVRGLLVEEQRTNIIPNANTGSPGFTSASSTDIPSLLSGATIWKTTWAAGATNGGAYVGLPVTVGNTYVFSAWLWVPSAYSLSQDGAPILNIDIATLGTGGVITTGTADMTKRDQWQRVTSTILVGTGASSAVNLVLRRPTPNTGGSVFYNTCWQLEQGTFPTSYIPTTGTAATRAVDIATVPASSFVFSPEFSTLAVEAQHPFACNEAIAVASLINTSAGTKTAINVQGGNTVAIFDSVNPINSALGVEPVGPIWKAAYAFKTGTQAGCLNGGALLNLSGTNLASGINRLDIGSAFTGLQYNGWIRRVRYWPRYMAGTELQQMTSLVPDTSFEFNLLHSTSLDARIVFARASSATYFDNTGTMQVAAANAPRFDYDRVTLAPLGLLIEEQRTNAVRNGEATGATSGTPGVAPSHWVIGKPAGVTSAILSVSAVNGMQVVRVRFFGTPTSASTCALVYENAGGLSGLAASATYVQSFYVALVAGSLTGVSSAQFWGPVSDSTGAGAQDLQPYVTITNTMTRISNVQTIPSSGSAPFSVPSSGLIFYNQVGVPLDFTIDFAAPQLEVGAFATSYIPTTGARGTTRAADQAYLPVGSWLNNYAGSVAIEFDTINSQPFAPIGLTDSTLTNSIYLTGNSIHAIIGGSDQSVSSGSISLTGGINKQAASYSSGKLSLSTNGSAVSTNSSLGNAPFAWTQRLSIGCSPSGLNGQIDGHVRRIRFWPSALPDTDLQQAAS
jgi:hypothetical protein